MNLVLKKPINFAKTILLKRWERLKKKRLLKKKKYQYCISPYSKTIKDSKDKKKLATEKAWKEVNKELEKSHKRMSKLYR